MENFSTSDLTQLLYLVGELRKDEPDVVINDNHLELAQHSAFCKALQIEGTSFARDRAERIRSAGRASIYKGLPAEIRFLSSDDLEVPDLPIIDLEASGAGKVQPDGAEDPVRRVID